MSAIDDLKGTLDEAIASIEEGRADIAKAWEKLLLHLDDPHLTEAAKMLRDDHLARYDSLLKLAQSFGKVGEQIDAFGRKVAPLLGGEEV